MTHTYYTLNGKLMRESFPYSDTTIIMDFIYDESGKPFAVCYSKDGGANFTPYFYATNLQGDVEGIFRVLKNGTTGLYEQKWYGRYTYDAWGNVTAYTAAGNSPGSTTLVYRNPIRYRGYVYDNETGFYYLQSRYYDPSNHRFINADNYASTGQGFTGTNMFAYCNNNPVNYCDESGSYSTYCTLMTDSGSINWKKPIKSKSQTDYNAVHQKMFAEISKESEYPFWSGVVSSAKVEQIADFHSSLGTAIARTIGTYAASYAGEKLAEKVAPKVLAKLGLKASGKTISIGIVVGSLCYDIYKTIKNYNELPSGDYNQFVISVEGYYDDFVVGIGICTYYYEHTLTIVEKTVGKNTTYIISSEAYYSWRE